MSNKRMPVVFVGHGSPMNAIEDNAFSRNWKALGERIGKPKAILAISAHWMTDKTAISTVDEYRQIYDMYGFPEELYQVKYNPPGAPDCAQRAMELLGGAVKPDNSWGLDHGLWSILASMYPQADVPVAVMSTGVRVKPQEQFEIGKKLRPLREEGVLILASGNVVHNLALIGWDVQGGYDWADQFDTAVTQAIKNRLFQDVIDYKKLPGHQKAFRTVEHFYPLLNALGAVEEGDQLTVFNEARQMGSLSMTSYLFEDGRQAE